MTLKAAVAIMPLSSKQGRARMNLGSIAVLVMLVAAAAPAKADAIDNLVGRWQGELAVAPEEKAGEPVRFSLAGNARGFDLALSIDGTDVAKMAFEPSDRPGVFVQKGRKGLLSMFKDDVSVNPLTGVPLIWSRVEDEQLVVYRLHIASSGSYLLDRVIIEAGDDGASIERTQLHHGAPTSHAEGRLVREGSK